MVNHLKFDFRKERSLGEVQVRPHQETCNKGLKDVEKSQIR